MVAIWGFYKRTEELQVTFIEYIKRKQKPCKNLFLRCVQRQNYAAPPMGLLQLLPIHERIRGDISMDYMVT